MTLEGKEIWIISPESWGLSLFSKHYYALTLAEMGNKVLFLQPGPAGKQPHPNITLVQDNSYIKGTNRLPDSLAKRIHRLQVKRIMSAYNSTPDLVWVFDDSQRKHFDVFLPAKVIYHLMDLRAGQHLASSAAHADLCIGVTAGIVEKLQAFSKRCLHVPHGYVDYLATSISVPTVEEPIKAAFVGNLLIPYLHWPSIVQTITQHPQVHFFFIGSTGAGNLNPNAPKQNPAPLELISQASNVTLVGELSPADVQTFISQCDFLFYSLEFPKNWGPVEDAHKILTYLGTGKPIVGTPLSAYSQTKDLIYFTEAEELHIRVKEVVENLVELSNPVLAEKRRGFALNQLYSEHIKRIEAIL